MFTPKHGKNSNLASVFVKMLGLFTPVHTSVMMYARCALSVFRSMFRFRKLSFSVFQSYPAKITDFCSPNQELSIGVQLVYLFWTKFVDPCKSPCSMCVDGKWFKCRNFIVVRPVLLENAFFHSANQELFSGLRLEELRLGKTVSPAKGTSCTLVEEKILSFVQRISRAVFLISWPILLKLPI